MFSRQRHAGDPDADRWSGSTRWTALGVATTTTLRRPIDTLEQSTLPSEWLPVIWGGEEQFALNQRQPPFQLVAASRQQEAE